MSSCWICSVSTSLPPSFGLLAWESYKTPRVSCPLSPLCCAVLLWEEHCPLLGAASARAPPALARATRAERVPPPVFSRSGALPPDMSSPEDEAKRCQLELDWLSNRQLPETTPKALYPSVLKASAASQQIISRATTVPDPFSPDYTGNNPWTGGKSGGDKGGGGTASNTVSKTQLQSTRPNNCIFINFFRAQTHRSRRS